MLLVYRSSLKGEFIRCVAHSLHCCSVWIVHFGDQSFESLPEAHGPFFTPCVIFHRSVAEAHVEKHGVMFKKVYRRYENCQWSPSWALRTMSKPFRLSTNNWQYLTYFFSAVKCARLMAMLNTVIWLLRSNSPEKDMTLSLYECRTCMSVIFSVNDQPHKWWNYVSIN